MIMKRMIVVVCLLFLVGGCFVDADPFGVNWARVGSGNYWIWRFDESDPALYYVCKNKNYPEVGCLFDGNFYEIGWNDKFILAKVKKLSREPNGWYILTRETGSIRGPVVFDEMIANPLYSGIKILSAEKGFAAAKKGMKETRQSNSLK